MVAIQRKPIQDERKALPIQKPLPVLVTKPAVIQKQQAVIDKPRQLPEPEKAAVKLPPVNVAPIVIPEAKIIPVSAIPVPEVKSGNTGIGGFNNSMLQSPPEPKPENDVSFFSKLGDKISGGAQALAKKVIIAHGKNSTEKAALKNALNNPVVQKNVLTPFGKGTSRIAAQAVISVATLGIGSAVSGASAAANAASAAKGASSIVTGVKAVVGVGGALGAAAASGGKSSSPLVSNQNSMDWGGVLNTGLQVLNNVITKGQTQPGTVQGPLKSAAEAGSSGSSGFSAASVPTWVYVVGGAVVLIFLFGKKLLRR